VTERQLTIEEWKKILSDAHRLGVKRLSISGGEPTLYKELVKLIRVGRSYGWHININSNGSLIDNKLARELVEAGLNEITISLYSSNPAIHDGMRRSKGLCAKAMHAIKVCSCLMSQYPHFSVTAQTIIYRDNYKDFAELLELHYALGARRTYASYLEGDFEKKHLLNRDEIEFFRKTIIPKADKLLKRRGVDISQQLDMIFSDKIANIADWEKGIYWSRDRKCNATGNFALIWANGDVFPCTMGEYTREPILGNLFEHSLPYIWQSQETKNFRENRHEKCNLCPMNIHPVIDYYPSREIPPVFRRIVRKLLGKNAYALIRNIYYYFKNK
jgi:MoaA/NifB/PqqE/SkfB family radical SAM enzyme